MGVSQTFQGELLEEGDPEALPGGLVQLGLEHLESPLVEHIEAALLHSLLVGSTVEGVGEGAFHMQYAYTAEGAAESSDGDK